VLEDPRQRDFDRSLEPHPEALSRIRVEGNFGEEFGLGAWKELRPDHEAIRRAFAKTSSAGIDFTSPRSYSSRRRSIAASHADSAMAGS
jgi:hypothetical protein